MSSLTLESIESPDFIGELLREQQSLTAVEQFSLHHELGTLTASRVPAQAKFYRGLLPATPPAAGQQYAFEVDLGACSGCKSCVAACHNLNGLEDEESWRRVGLLTSHDSDWPVVQHVTSACHHCVEPGCLSGCPVQAYEKDPLTGIVRHLDDQCFGCKYCTMMCPYEVPQYSKRLGIVRKCDMCSQRLAVGEAPACVQACPNQAIRISIVDQLSIVNETFGVGQPLLHTAPPPELTKPTTRYVSATKPQLMPADLTRDLAEESHLPLVIMLTLSQMSVGMLVMATLAVWFDGSKSSSLIATVVVGCFLGLIGIHAALLHLGRPSLAYRAFLGWRTSWLSREAIVFGVFMGLIVPTSASMLLQADTFGFLSKNLTQFLTSASTSLLTASKKAAC